jgi:hypothetical protein
MPLSPNFGGQISGTGKSKGGGSNAQIFPARVKDIILQPSTDPNSLFALNAGYTSIAYISFHPLKSVVDTPNQSNLIASPLDINLRRVPLLNEVVLIMSSTDVMNEDQLAQKYYYISGISIWNSVHHNGFPDLQYLGATQKSTNIVGYQSNQDGIVKKQDDAPKDLYLGNTFIENPEIRNLFPVEGDVIVEGRFGNSMRLSHTSKFPSQSVTSPWSNYGSNTRPITIIRNGQTKQVPAVKWTPIFESIDGDASSIYLTNGQEIQMTLASRNLASYGTVISSSADVVQVPNVLIQPRNMSLKNADDDELKQAVSESKTSPPINVNAITIISSSISSSVSASTTFVNNSSIVTTNPTASVDGYEQKTTPKDQPGSSKLQAIPESSMGPLTWLGEEVSELGYTQDYAEDDETQYWLETPEPAAIPDAVTKIIEPPPPPPPTSTPSGNGPTGSGPSGTPPSGGSPPPASTLTKEQIAAAEKAAAEGLDVLPGVYTGNGGVKFKLAAITNSLVCTVEACKIFFVMAAVAKRDGVNLLVTSGFRPPYEGIPATKTPKGKTIQATGQITARGPSHYKPDYYDVYKKGKCGPYTIERRDNAYSKCWDAQVGRPGFSKHGSGLALDLAVYADPKNPDSNYPKNSPFNDTYVWMALNGWKFGYVRRLDDEPWHWEYWGDEAKKGGPYVKFGGSPDRQFRRLKAGLLNGRIYDLSNIQWK